MRGSGMVTPVKKRPRATRSEQDKASNTALAKIRVGADWGFAHAKNWGVLSGRYRGDLENIDPVIQAVTGLQVIKERFSGRRIIFH
jgi:hypothetical protein